MITHISERFNMAKSSIDLIKAVGNDIKMSIDDLIDQIQLLKEEVENLKKEIKNNQSLC